MWHGAITSAPADCSWPGTTGLAMADAIVYATARDQDAEVVTGDADLKNLAGVIYVN